MVHAVGNTFAIVMHRSLSLVSPLPATHHAQVNDIMVKNIEMVLERGEGIDLLVEKSDILGTVRYIYDVWLWECVVCYYCCSSYIQCVLQLCILVCMLFMFIC